jgi:AcrR family transcriptional regulator
VGEEELGPLPAGRHGFSREQVAHNQRERLIAALATAVAEHGYGAVTITHITKQARVSRRVFYENFAGKEECFLAAFEVVAGHVRELAGEAVAPLPDWPHRAIAASRAVLAFLASEPDLARLCLVESQGAGPAVAARFHEAVHEAVPCLRVGRAERERDRDLPESTEESIIGALALLAGRKAAAGEAARLEDLLPDFAEFVLSPYLGAAEATRLVHAAA